MFHDVTAVGYIGNDAELRETKGGTSVTNFNLATSRRGKDGENFTTWFRVTIWGNFGESLHPYLTKGKAVLVTGELRGDPETGGPRVYEKNDGTTAASYELTCNKFAFVGRKDDVPGDVEQSTAKDDAIPF